MEVLPPTDDQPASWLEPVPTRYRRTRAAIAAFLAIGIAGWIGVLQFQSGVFGQAPSFWILVPLTIGAWRFRHWMNPDLPAQRKYASVTVPLTVKERVKQSAPVWLTGFAGAIFIFWTQYEHDQLHDNWGWGALFVAMGVGGLLMLAFRRTEVRLTPEGTQARAYYDQIEKQEGEAKEKRFNAFIDQPIVRYPLAAAIFWLAYLLTEQPRFGTREWIELLCALGWGMWLAREVFKWILSIAIVGGIYWALFAGVAALPVSVAVIIGALIIAAAVKGK